MADQADFPNTPQESATPEPELDSGTEQENAVIDRFKRMFAVIMSPAEAMRGVKLNGGWLYPFLFFIIAGIIWALTAGPMIGEAGVDAARDQMQERVAQGQMTQEQADQALEISARFQTGMAGSMMQLVGMIFVIFLFSLITAVLLLLVGNVIHNGTESFGKYWSLVWYAGIPGFIGMILSGILIMVTQDAHGGYLGLALLTKSDPTTALHQAANAVNVFTVWEAFIVGIAISMFGKVGRGIGIVWGIIIIVLIPALLAYGMTSLFGGMAG